MKCALRGFCKARFYYTGGRKMCLEREIERAVKRTVALDKNTAHKSTEEQETIISNAMTAFNNNNLYRDFNKVKTLILNQNGKKRLVKQYDDLYSPANILCQCIKQILDKAFKVKYPNRSNTIRTLFSTLSAAVHMSDFTIVKFDFKDYFNSVSSIYVFEKYLRYHISNRQERDLIKTFVYSTKYAYAGLCTSNAIAEIIAGYFDEAIRQKFFSNGIIFYERYIDDSILVLNEHMEKKEVEEKLKAVLVNIFHDKTITSHQCNTEYNYKKFKYISRREILTSSCSVDFLGYEFWLLPVNNKHIKIQYGITEDKRKKYEDRIDKLISYYANSHDPNKLELLRHRIAAFSSRVVYVTKRFHSNIWKVKGFIENYKELRYILCAEYEMETKNRRKLKKEERLIEEKTAEFLKEVIKNRFNNAGIEPYFLKGGSQLNLKCGYNLYGNMIANKTILLVDRIGYNYKSLVALCKQVGISDTDTKGRRRSYGALVREYLIKIKVGY